MHMFSSRVVFPVLLIGPALATALLLWFSVPPALAMTIVVLGLLAIIVLLERRAPFRAAWNEGPRGETVTDVAYIAFASIPDRVTRILVEAAMIGLLGLSAASAAPRSWLEVGLYAALAFVVADLGKYLIHRASHRHAWLWRYHVAHHQPARLSAWNALRLHPVNVAYNAAIDTVPLLIFGVPPAAAAILATLRATVGIVQHANLKLEAGRQWLVNAPSYHRTHHDVQLAEANHNFASTLLVWDRLFGTLRRAPAPEAVGVATTSHRLPSGFLGQLLYPLCVERLDTTCWLARYRWLTR